MSGVRHEEIIEPPLKKPEKFKHFLSWLAGKLRKKKKKKKDHTYESFGLILQNLKLICVIGTVQTYLGFREERLNFGKKKDKGK